MNDVMKFILFFIILFYSLGSYAQRIEYKLSEIKQEAGKNLIGIQMRFKADPSGVTKLVLPNQWTDADRLFENIINLRLQDQKAKNIFLIHGDSFAEKYIISPPNTDIKLTYDLISDGHHHFKPNITKKYFSFIGKTAFVVPIFESDDGCNEMILHWSVPLKQKAYRIVNSYGLDELFQKVSTEALLEGVFLGGELLICTHGDEKNRIIFAYNNLFRSAFEIEWEKDTLDLIATQRAAMQDTNDPYYFVSMVKNNQLEQPFSATHLKNSVLFVYGDEWLALSRAELIRYTAHELFHHWMGQKIKASNDYLSAMWFFEGFNDFLSIELAFQSGFLIEQAYIDIKNRVLSAHYFSPFQAIPNREVALYYWDNPELHGLPYVRGHLFAQFCDQILKKQDRSLLDVVRLLAQPNGQYYKEAFTERELINVLSELISEDIYEAYVKYFIRCERFKDEIDLNIKKHPLTFISDKFPKYDIDLVATFLENRIIGLSKKSEAYRFGLREGWLVNNIEIDPLLKRKSIKIHVFNDNNELKTVTLNPSYQEMKIPVFN